MLKLGIWGFGNFQFSAMNSGDLNKVWEIKALKKAGQEEARKILERIAKQVQPIMLKHKWRVKLLSEFCPTNPALLGLNVGGGVHVKLRLRRPNRDWDFFPFDQVLDTMLHELCHNAHGPHNASFYKLWDELRKECEELMSKGITGTEQGFDLPGRRLGGFSRQPPPSALRKSAVAAAENRARLGSLLPSGPKRLGGDSSIMAALSPVQAAAMAAERRLQDDIWCASSQAVSVDEECCSDISSDLLQSGKRVANSEPISDLSIQGRREISRKRRRVSDQDVIRSSNNYSEPDIVDFSINVLTSKSSINNDTGSSRTTVSGNTSLQSFAKSSFIDLSNQSSGMASSHHGEPAMWECGTCTLLNPPLAPLCEVCSTEKPRDIQSKSKFWSCKFCTLENSVNLDKCSACGQWRYSTGPPLSTRGPNLGT